MEQFENQIQYPKKNCSKWPILFRCL